MSGVIDLSRLPPPEVVEALSYETILEALRADLVVCDPDLAPTLSLESEPLNKLLEVCAYREMLLRQRVNDAARAVMVAYAGGTDLEHLGALLGVSRLLLNSGDPAATLPTWEDDARLRMRIQMALEGFSKAGPAGAYVWHALSAAARVKDASVISPAPGEVLVTILSAEGNGVPTPDLLVAVEAALTAETVRPLTDHVTVRGAEILPYRVDALLHLLDGPDAGVVRADAEAATRAYCAATHRLGRDLALSGLYAALHRPGVARVELSSPTDGRGVAPWQATYCTAMTIACA